MSFGLSPSIDIQERDFLTPSRKTANRFAGFVGDFNWGPVNELLMVTDEKVLAENFNGPEAANAADWYCASNYLAYNDKLYIARSIKEAGSLNAGIAIFSEKLVKFVTKTEAGPAIAAGDTITSGANTGIVVAASTHLLWVLETGGTGFADESTISNGASPTPGTAVIDSITADVQSMPFSVLRKNIVHEPTVSDEDYIKFKIAARYPGSYGNNLSVAIANSTGFAAGAINADYDFADVFEFAPASGEVALAVLLNDSIVETFIVSLTEGAKNYKGDSYYIETYIDRNSKYIYVYDNDDEDFDDSIEEVDLADGAHVAPESTDLITSWDLFANKEEIEIDVLFEGASVDITGGEDVAEKMVDIADDRKDCRVVLGVQKVDVVNIAIATAISNMITYAGTTLSVDSSYAAIYGNYKYQKDRYNDTYVWVPVTGDIAGIYSIGQSWEAPAGINRGVIKNCVKLAINPNEGYRDQMYPLGINPVYTLKNVGHVVMGQKTMKTSVPTIFSRVDIRGLFILLEKNAADVARYYQFQKNTATERRRFVSDVEPLFKQVVGLGGIEEYLIVCDETNNAEAAAEFTMVADFYIKPTYSAEWIRLNFNATQNSINFDEVIGSPYTTR